MGVVWMLEYSQHHAQTIRPAENYISTNFGANVHEIKKISFQPQKKMRLFFSFTHQKFRVRVNHTITQSK